MTICKRLPYRLILAAAALFVLSVHEPGPARAESAVLHKVSGLGGECRLLKVDSIYFMDGGRRGWYLYVGGMRRFANMNVSLIHRAARGGVLTLDVVGCTLNFIALPIPTPYVIELPLRDIPRARRVRIVGANGQSIRSLPGR